jgi:cell division protein FtsL
MAKSRVKRGRWIVAGVLIGFVIVSAAVVARRSYGHREGVSLTALERKKVTLESERVRLDQEIRDGSSRARLLPVAERLGMRMPSESQIVVLERQPRNRGTP